MKTLECVDGFKIINLKFKRPFGMIVTLPNANQSLFKFGLDERKFPVPIQHNFRFDMEEEESHFQQARS